MKSPDASYYIGKDGRRVTWLFKFAQPNAEAIGRLWEILEEMQVASHDDRQAPKGFKRKQANAELSRQQLMHRIRKSLEEDYAENTEDCETGNVGFDYVVSFDAHYAGSLAVMTRLFNKTDTDSGNIYYGCEIRRIGEDRYLLWGDE